MLEHSNAAQEIRDLWLEYEAGITNEARMVKEIDRLEMIIQACEYEQSDAKNLQPFFDSATPTFRHPLIQSISELVFGERPDKNFE
jgi:putative hydrolases of HD superfamily